MSSPSSASSQAAPSFQVGDKVELKGLVGKPYLNGRVGKIVGSVDSSSGRYPVDLLKPWIDIDGPDKKTMKYHTLNVKQENLIQFILYVERGADGDGATCAVHCEFCGVTKLAKDLKLCSQCKIVSYCSAVCQRMDWKEHKQYCKIFRQGRKDKGVLEQLDPLVQIRIRQERATKSLEQGDLLGAEHDFRRLVESRALNGPMKHFNLANVLWRRFEDENDERCGDEGMLEEAIREARLATTKDFHPNDAKSDEEQAAARGNAWSLLGYCLARNHQYEEGMLHP